MGARRNSRKCGRFRGRQVASFAIGLRTLFFYCLRTAFVLCLLIISFCGRFFFLFFYFSFFRFNRFENLRRIVVVVWRCVVGIYCVRRKRILAVSVLDLAIQVHNHHAFRIVKVVLTMTYQAKNVHFPSAGRILHRRRVSLWGRRRSRTAALHSTFLFKCCSHLVSNRTHENPFLMLHQLWRAL